MGSLDGNGWPIFCTFHNHYDYDYYYYYSILFLFYYYSITILFYSICPIFQIG